MRQLRARLGLDSGYLSRLLRSLEAANLVRVEPSEHDRRVRTARLTRAGLAERERLDRGSDDLARAFLDPLSPPRRERLVAAMAEVEQLLTAGMVEIKPVDPTGREARFCVNEYFAELGRRFENGYDPRSALPVAPDELRPPAGAFLVASLRGEPIGCGGIKFHGAGPGEIKRMWVAQRARGLGVGRRLLTELEARARARGIRVVRLETNRSLAEAISLYRSAGYEEVDAFNDEPYGHHWFAKSLAPD